MGGLLRTLALAALPLSPCHIEGLAEEVLCGTHRVFEDRGAQRGRTIDLKVAVVPALRREAADDPLFILAGGPGQGATKYGALIPLAFREIRRTRDIVLVDRRTPARVPRAAAARRSSPSPSHDRGFRNTPSPALLRYAGEGTPPSTDEPLVS